MELTRRGLAAVLLATMVALPSAQGPASPSSSLTLEQIETFLLEGDLSNFRAIGTGVTAPKRATMTDDTLTHDVQIQDVDIERRIFNAGAFSEVGFRDTFLFNIAAYRLAKLIGLHHVPPSVQRTVDGMPAAVTWWIDDAITDEERNKQGKKAPNPLYYSRQTSVLNVFDELIQNRDRNQGNILWANADDTMWLIDHTRAFRIGTDLLDPDKLVNCERGLLERMRALTEDQLDEATRDVLTGRQRDALLERRDKIVELFDARIAKYGEEFVLFSY